MYYKMHILLYFEKPLIQNLIMKYNYRMHKNLMYQQKLYDILNVFMSFLVFRVRV